MKKLGLLLFAMTCTLGLWACSKEPASTVATAAPAETTIQQETNQSTQSPEPQNWTGVDEQTRKFLTEQLTTFGTWYNLGLTSQYISPEFLDPASFFCLGTDGECIPFTPEELDLLEEEGYNHLAMNSGRHKLDRQRADQVLNEIFSISMEDLTHPEAPRIHAGIDYHPALDAYSASSSFCDDFRKEFSQVELKDAIPLANGELEVFYALPSGAEGVITLAQLDGVWKIRSNLNLQDYQAYAVDYSAREKTLWNPVIPLQISYIDYFSQERIYPKQQDDDPLGWDDQYSLSCDGKHYLVRQSRQRYHLGEMVTEQALSWVIPNVSTDDGITFRIAMSDYLYGVRGNDIIQMDYWGNIQVLFTDETGSLGKMDPLSVPFLLEDQRVLFFLAGAGERMGIYRVYLPNHQVDLFYDDLESCEDFCDGNGCRNFVFNYAYSNQELVWTRENTAFLAYFRSLWNDSDSIFYTPEYESIGEEHWLGKLAEDEDQDPFFACYYSAKTGTYAEAVMGRESSLVTYQDLSPLERTPWWN